MARLPFRCSDDVICAGLDALRVELEIPAHFSDEVLAEAEASAHAGPTIPSGSAGTSIVDRTDLELVTIDPPGSMDLDQAVTVVRNGVQVFQGKVQRKVATMMRSLAERGDPSYVFPAVVTISEKTRAATFRGKVAD